MSNDHNIPPFFKRRIDHHKFEKMMRKGISYIYHDSKSLEEFKWKLVQATLENYLHYKYEIELYTVPVYDVSDFIKYMVDTYEPVLKAYYYNQRKNSGNINENYSPAGKEITPNRIVIHKSSPVWRESILRIGLEVSAGDCYTTYVGYGEKCIPAIFATNSTNKRAWFDSTYNDDVWAINTNLIPNIKWYKDRHFESSKKHIVTFDNIPPEAIELIHEGNGRSLWRESINDDKLSKGSINESNLAETFNKIVNKSINTIKNICDTSDNETWPDWLNFDTCDVLDTLGNVNVKNVEKIKKNFGKYPMFNVYIDVNFSSVFEWVDYDDFFISTVASDIIRTHNIRLIFHIDEQNNTHNRQMESSSKKLIKKILKEETNLLKKYFTKVWDTKKSEGKIPMFNLKQISNLGLLKRVDEIRNYYIEYIGGQEELVRNIKNYFIGKTFTTQDVEDMDIGVGNYDFVFKIVDMSFEQTNITANGDSELYASFDIIEGTVDTFNGEHYNLTDHELINDELWWELDSEIKEIIENFIWHTVNSLGVEIDQVYLEWG